MLANDCNLHGFKLKIQTWVNFTNFSYTCILQLCLILLFPAVHGYFTFSLTIIYDWFLNNIYIATDHTILSSQIYNF